MEEFHYTRHLDGALAAIAGKPRGHQDQDGTKALAAGAGRELANLVDERHRRLDLSADCVLDRPELRTDGERDAIL